MHCKCSLNALVFVVPFIVVDYYKMHFPLDILVCHSRYGR